MLSAQHSHCPVYRALAQERLTPAARRIGLVLLEHGGQGITQSELARMFGFDPSTVNTAIRELREAGIVRIAKRGTRAEPTQYAFLALEHGSREHELSEVNDHETA